MSKMQKAVMSGIVAVAFVFLIAAGATDMYAKGEGGHAPEGMHLKGPALQGMLTATYVAPYSGAGECFNESYGCVNISFTVKCKASSGVTFNVLKDLEKPVSEYGEEDLANLVFLGAGPPGCASVEGGEDLVVKQVFRFSNTFSPENPGGAISADMFLLYVVDYSANNPAQ